MAQDWIALTGDDLWQIVSRKVAQAADEDSAGGSYEAGDIDTALDTRSSKAVAHAVAEVRGAVENAGRYPVSLTADSVPPEGVRHTLALAAYVLIGPKPSLASVVMTDGSTAPLQKLYDDAKKWLEAVNKGGSIISPTDPAGQDYQTAISDSNPAVRGIHWGDYTATDLEFEAGETSEGLTLPVDMTT